MEMICLDQKEKKKIISDFQELCAQFDKTYESNSPFYDENDCMSWYENAFDIIDKETDKYKESFIKNDDKREVKFTSEIAKNFLKEKLEKEPYDSIDFKAFVLEYLIK